MTKAEEKRMKALENVATAARAVYEALAEPTPGMGDLSAALRALDRTPAPHASRGRRAHA
jgi:hypothetical protein